MGQQFDFNPMQHDVQTALEQMPAAWYKAVGSKAEIKETEAKDGIGLEVSWKIIEGPYKDRVVKKWYNVRNPSVQAVAIAQKEITSFCGSMGIWSPIQNTDQIINIPLQIKLTAKKDSDYNDVKGYKTINGDDPVKPGTGAQPMAAVPYAQVAAAPPAAPPALPPAAPPAPPAVAATWPPHGWSQHPTSPGHFYQGQEVLTEAELRARHAPPTPPAAPQPPAVPPAPPAYAPPPAQQPGAPPAYSPQAPAPPAAGANPAAPQVWQPGPPAAPWTP